MVNRTKTQHERFSILIGVFDRRCASAVPRSLALGFGFRPFQAAGKRSDFLTHDFSRFEFDRCPRRNGEIAARLVRVAPDTRFRELDFENAEITNLDIVSTREAFSDVVKRPLHNVEDLMLHHACLVTNFYHYVPFRQVWHRVFPLFRMLCEKYLELIGSQTSGERVYHACWDAHRTPLAVLRRVLPTSCPDALARPQLYGCVAVKGKCGFVKNEPFSAATRLPGVRPHIGSGA